MQALTQDATMCDQCHREQRLREGWNHGPVNLGTCIPCHVAHESQYPHLLERPVPDVCLVCHETEMERKTEYHAVENVNQCTACHNPHRMY
jgi:predicted CXXCH cytochrome family protein